MIIVQIIGGLGNQMFQYAYAVALKEDGYDVLLDLSAFDNYKLHDYGLNKYGISMKSATKNNLNKIKFSFFNRLLSKLKIQNNTINEESLLFDKKLLLPKNNSYIEGYFQSEKYFLKYRDLLLNEFILNGEVSNYTQSIKDMIMSSKTLTVSLHIRRGDYLNNINKEIHGVCSMDYYHNCMQVIDEKFVQVQYFVFSDDISWVKENLKIENGVFVESKENRLPHEDIYLMSCCQHNIIANSSFSWWGAWLNPNPNKIVLAPSRWFNDSSKNTRDLIPLEWLKCD